MYLRVELPAKPLGKGGGEVRTRARIGRKVAPLFGIPGGPEDGDAGAGRRWLGSYSEMTMTELLLGGPLVMKPRETRDGRVEDLGVFTTAGRRAEPVDTAEAPDAGLGPITGEPISPTLINGYLPGPQSAVTLLGINAVLAPLTDALVTVLREMDFPDTRLLVGTTSMLLSEAFRSQPLLVLAGVQASRIQQALRLEDDVMVLAEPPTAAPWRCSRLDLPWARHERQTNPNARTPPLLLDLVQEVWASLLHRPGAVRLQPRQTNRIEIEQPHATSQISLPGETALGAARALTERVAFGLGGGTAGTHIVVRRRADGGFDADFIGVATRPARVVVDRMVGTQVVDDSSRATGLSGSPVPAFDIERWRAEPPLVQRVALWAHHCAERFVVSGAWSVAAPHDATFRDAIAQRRVLAEAAGQLLGPDHPLAVELRIFHASYRLEQARRSCTTPSEPSDEEGADLDGDLDRAVDDFLAAIEAMTRLHAEGAVLDSHLVESLQPTLMDLAPLHDVAVEIGRTDVAAKALRILREYWGRYLQVQLSLLEAPPPSPRDPEEILHALAADGAWADPTWRALLESSPALATSVALYHPDLQLATRIQENSRRRRTEIYEIEGDWPPYRQSLIYEALLKMRCYQASDSEAERSRTIKEVAEIAETVVATELQIHGSPRADILLRPGLAEDSLLLTLAEYLTLHQKDPLPSREGSGLQHQIASALHTFRACSRRRLDNPLWDAAPLQPYRDALRTVLDRNVQGGTT